MSDGDSLIVGGARYEFGAGLKADCVVVKIGSKQATEGFLAQQVQCQVSKQPRQVYEIGSQKHYVIDARPSGSGTITHLIGPNTQDVFQTLANFGDVCKPTSVTIGAKTKCACAPGFFWGTRQVGQGGAFEFKDGTLNSIQVSATAQDYVITSSVGFMFFDVAKATVS